MNLLGIMSIKIHTGTYYMSPESGTGFRGT